jgi:arylsulfatase
MGYQTPNIDRIANEGVVFTDYYALSNWETWIAATAPSTSPARTNACTASPVR